MRHTIRVVTVLALVWIGYLAWPIYDLFVLIRAVETRDAGAVTNGVYFDAVRVSLSNQVVDAYLRRARIQIGPLRRNMAAAAIANPVVERLISPEAVSQLLSAGWPTPVLPAPPGTVGITTDTIGTVWRVFANSEYGFGRFEVAAPAGLPRQPLSSPVPTFAVALATGRDHHSRAYCELARGRARQGRAKMIARTAP
jgi:hypothetical protein